MNADLARLIDESNQNPKAHKPLATQVASERVSAEGRRRESQIAKYLTLSDNLILIDYLRFLRIAKDDKGKIVITQEITICALNEIQAILKNKSALKSKQSEILDFFALFFSSTPKPINTALEFAESLAQRTRLVFDILTQNPQNPQISTLYQNFRDILYKDLDFESFCDSFAQTLTYALFLARLNNSTEPNQSETIDLYNAKKFIPKSFPLIRAMSGFLDNLDELDSLKWLIKEILSIINHIDPAQITLELNKIADKDLLGDYLHKDPYLHFYETFLSQYDPKLRELRGVYYTPFAVVSFIINAIDSTLKSDFGEAKGLGSALNNDTITLLDFATGTGTFLLEAFRKALDSTPKNSLHYKPKNLLNRFSGFEFLIAPYTIAHLKISQSFKEEFNAPLSDNEKLNILLTNTIYAKSAKDEQNTKSTLFAGMYELALEFLGAQNLKEQSILIITGNPPYSGASANKGLYEDEVKIAYGLEPSHANLNAEAQRIIKSYFANPSDKAKQKDFRGIYESRKLQNEKNPKWLLDDYVKFIRFAESKIESQDSGIIAIISNNSFLDNPTFRGMRWHLLNTFDTIYIVDLHGNARKKEVAPNGNKDDNVFDIMQGVCISVFVKTGAKKLNPSLASSESKSPLPCEVESNLSPLPCGGGLGVGKNTTKSTNPPPISPSAREGEQDTDSLAREGESNLAQIYHYDLYGRRKDKYAFLQGNSLKSVAWSELAPKAPFYLFIPQNEALREQYDKGISVKDMFRVSSVGIVSGRDSILIAPNEQILESQIKEHYKEFDKILCKDIAYRPFDIRKIYYDKTKIDRPRSEVMKHFILPPQNKSKDSPSLAEGVRGWVKTDKSQNHRQLTPYMKEFSRQMRKNPTDAENKLWQELRGKKLGFRFRRQFVIDSKYIADFVCLEKRLIIECDGGQHNQNFEDIERDFYLESQNFRILRFWNNEILENLEGVLCVIKETLESDFADTKSTHPLTPSAREGELQSSTPQNNAEFRSNDNVGLVCDKGCKLQNVDNFFVANNIIDKHLNGGSGYAFPLYLIESDSRIENFTQSFRAFIDAKYGESYAPEVILGYIYAILYHKDYREKYVDFLKIDFPKVPFVQSKKDFLALSVLGCELVDLHLMRVDLSGESVGEPIFNDTANKNERIDKIAYNAESKRLFVNASLYFDAVSAEVWEYKIGGYAVLDKYLKSHKGENINYAHFERVIKTLHKSLQIQAKIAQIELG